MAELVYPSSIYCISCGNLIDKTRKYSLCDTCIESINWIVEKSCEKCGRPLNDDRLNKCDICRYENHNFDKGYVCAEYTDETKSIVVKLKFQGQAYIAEKLADIMKDKLDEDIKKYDFITCVPIHKKRELERGYNQASLIAQKLALLTGLDFIPLLLKNRHTDKMSKLGRDMRRINLHGAFEISRQGKKYCNNFHRILLVDDVMTTGSTLDECAEVLRENGFIVDVIAFAAGRSLLIGDDR